MALPVLLRTTPLRRRTRRLPLWNLSTEMDHLFGDLRRAPAAPRAAHAPRIDLVETASEIRVSAELPGLGAEDFHIEFEDGVLRLHGDKNAPATPEDEQFAWHRAERGYGPFERSIRIPVDVDAEAAKAQYKDGVLVVTMPKTPAAQTREIPVEAAAS